MLFCAPLYQTYNVVHSFNKHKHLLKVQQPGCTFKGTNDITLRHIKQTCSLHRYTWYHVCYVTRERNYECLAAMVSGKQRIRFMIRLSHTGNGRYNSPSNARTLKRKSRRWAGHADKGHKECHQNYGEGTSWKGDSCKTDTDGGKLGEVS